jgi:hypothetical protein
MAKNMNINETIEDYVNKLGIVADDLEQHVHFLQNVVSSIRPKLESIIADDLEHQVSVLQRIICLIRAEIKAGELDYHAVAGE